LRTSTPRSRPKRRTAEATTIRRNRLPLEVPIGKLKPNPRNPRNHNAAQIEAIAKSIDAFGFNAPILVDREDTIIAGHGRYSVPVIRLEHLTPAQAQAYMLADNKLSDRSADSDEAGHAFQSEAGHLFRREAGQGSDLMPATRGVVSSGLDG
jgi:ParB-like chromosome segregation protein Spo0J